MSEKPIKSHDGFFQKIFSQKAEAKEFLEKTTPTEIVKKLHLNTLQLDTTNYVDDSLKKYFADVVYNCDYSFNNKETKQVKITFLFEHKSFKAKIPHLQLANYLFKIWSKQVELQGDNIKARLKPIIPIVFYHGTSDWNKQPFENYFEGMDNFLLQFLPQFDYHLIDLKNYENFEIKQRFGKWKLQTSLLLMKNIFYGENLLKIVTDLYKNPKGIKDKEQLNQFYEIISSYIFNLSNKDIQTKIIEIMENLRTQQSENFISIADSIKMEGKLEGEINGIEKEKKRTAFAMIRKGYPDEIIMDATNISIMQIELFRRQIDYNNGKNN